MNLTQVLKWGGAVAGVEKIAKTAGVTLLLFLIFWASYALAHAAIVFVVSYLNHVANNIASPRQYTEYAERFLTYNARIVGAVLAPAVSVSMCKFVGRKMGGERYRTPLTIGIVLFVAGGWLLHSPNYRELWADKAINILESVAIISFAVSLLSTATWAAVFGPILRPIIYFIIRDKR
ncbi:MAG: hypothetical protein Q8Q88_23925 [Phenylobacterium sp.]|uniref:hypothetical protein n=1 Tax=Phenylobacterium sp. TaxID=1871053 RepID=UPI00273688FA|nr:hypothetical protein [Phenylobacterium sp.]MDP3750085.1 hypothetical protein [Phenylobacterium sp.]